MAWRDQDVTVRVPPDEYDHYDGLAELNDRPVKEFLLDEMNWEITFERATRE